MRLLALIIGALLTVGTLRAAETGTQSGAATSVVETNSDAIGIDVLDDKIKLNTGMIISFRVKEDKSPAVSLMVSDTGDIELPETLGRVRAAGRTCKELARDLKAFLEKDYYQTATLVIAVQSINAANQEEILIQGQVGRPGPIRIPPGQEATFTLSKAIFAAGGLNLYAKSTAIEVIRPANPDKGQPKEQKWVINFKEITEDAKRDNDILIKPGDLITVERKIFVF
jgi:polysaccharide biosynthesis/export protein